MNSREVHVGRWEQHVQRAGGSRTQRERPTAPSGLNLGFLAEAAGGGMLRRDWGTSFPSLDARGEAAFPRHLQLTVNFKLIIHIWGCW